MVQDKTFRQKIASTKFFTMNFYEVVWIGMVLTGGITEAVFQALTMMTVGGYFAFDTLAKFSKGN